MPVSSTNPRPKTTPYPIPTPSGAEIIMMSEATSRTNERFQSSLARLVKGNVAITRGIVSPGALFSDGIVRQ